MTVAAVIVVSCSNRACEGGCHEATRLGIRDSFSSVLFFNDLSENICVTNNIYLYSFLSQSWSVDYPIFSELWNSVKVVMEVAFGT